MPDATPAASRLRWPAVAALAVVVTLALRCAADDPPGMPPPRGASTADVLAGRIPGPATAAQAAQACRRALQDALPPGTTISAPVVTGPAGGPYRVSVTAFPPGSDRRCEVDAAGVVSIRP